MADEPMVVVKMLKSSSVTAVAPRSGNKISFEIANDGGTDLTGLQAILTLPCGKKQDGTNFLLSKNDDHIKVETTLSSNSSEAVDIGACNQAKKGILSWQTRSLGFRLKKLETLTIAVSDFATPYDGKATIQLKIMKSLKLLNKESSFDIEVKTPTGVVAIIDFAVKRSYIRAKEKVEFSGRTENAKQRAVFAGNEQKWIQKAPFASDFKKETIEGPSANTTYTLKAWREVQTEVVGQKAEEPNDHIELQVYVEKLGQWDSRPLVSGHYPALLLKSETPLGGGTGERLYGVFIQDQPHGEDVWTRAATLWSSEAGFDDWKIVEKPEVPDGMAESPGVIHKGMLWLIGGSSADPTGPRSKSVWCWHPAKGWIHAKEPPSDFQPRMGHACADFDGKIWVLGGLSTDNHPLDDVWTCEVKTDAGGNLVDTHWEEAKRLPAEKKEKLKLPTAGCVFAVVATPKEDRLFKEARLWVYGGASHPYSVKPFNKLWYIKPAPKQSPLYAGWSPYTAPEKELDPPARGRVPLTENPVGAALWYAQDKLHLSGYFGQGNTQSKTIYGLTSIEDLTWTPEGQEWNWTFEEKVMFLIRAVSFRRYWICYPVYMHMDELTSKYPRIYVESD
jgi:hypothetical protein